MNNESGVTLWCTGCSTRKLKEDIVLEIKFLKRKRGWHRGKVKYYCETCADIMLDNNMYLDNTGYREEN